VKSNDELENYLKHFKPVAPDPLLAIERTPFIDRNLRLVGWSAAAAILVGAVMMLRVRSIPPEQVQSQRAATQLQPLTESRPLTIAGANAMVAGSPSVQTVINDLAFRAPAAKVSKGMQSALDVLGKEKTKL